MASDGLDTVTVAPEADRLVSRSGEDVAIIESENRPHSELMTLESLNTMPMSPNPASLIPRPRDDDWLLRSAGNSQGADIISVPNKGENRNSGIRGGMGVDDILPASTQHQT